MAKLSNSTHFYSGIIIPEHSHGILANLGPLRLRVTARMDVGEAAVTFDQKSTQTHLPPHTQFTEHCSLLKSACPKLPLAIMPVCAGIPPSFSPWDDTGSCGLHD
jgi:hypothetical protein